MNWHEVAGWIVAGLATGWMLVWRNRQLLMLHAAEAVAFAEKYYWGASNEVLEREAVRYFEQYWPSVPGTLVRLFIRELCRRRKVRAQGLKPPR